MFMKSPQDALDTLFVKINEATVAESYGIEDRPSLVVFEKGIPNVYEGDLYDSDLGNSGLTRLSVGSLYSHWNNSKYATVSYCC